MKEHTMQARLKIAVPVLAILMSTAAFADAGKSCDVETARKFQSTKEYQRAAACLEEAVAGGSGEAMLLLGNLRIDGLGIAQDAGKAEMLFLGAAAQGQKMAAHNLGVMYEKGAVGKPDFAKAVKYYRDAAQLGVVGSQLNLGLMYLNGKGIPVDYAEGEKLLIQAAHAGDTQAEVNLGILYLNGYKGKSTALVLPWLEHAALNGHPVAPQVLGMLYENGIGVPVDKHQAYTWFLVSDKKGFADAQKSIGAMQAKLTAEEREDAGKRADAWLSKQQASMVKNDTLENELPAVHSRCAVLVRVEPPIPAEHANGEALFLGIVNEKTTGMIGSRLRKYRLAPLDVRAEDRQRTQELMLSSMASNDCTKAIQMTHAYTEDASGTHMQFTLWVYQSAADKAERVAPIYRKTYGIDMKGAMNFDFRILAERVSKDVEASGVIGSIFR